MPVMCAANFIRFSAPTLTDLRWCSCAICFFLLFLFQSLPNTPFMLCFKAGKSKWWRWDEKFSVAGKAVLVWYLGSGTSWAGSARTCQRLKGTMQCVLSSDSQSKRCKSQRPNERMRLINPRGYRRLRMVGVMGRLHCPPRPPPT